MGDGGGVAVKWTRDNNTTTDNTHHHNRVVSEVLCLSVKSSGIGLDPED